MRFRIRRITMISVKLLTPLFLVILLVYYISGDKFNTLQMKFAKIQYQHDASKCEFIHIGIVWIGYQSNFYLYTMLKSLYFYRTKPLHFHVIVDEISETHLKNMFDKWDVPQVNVSFYNVNTFSPYSPLTSNNVKLIFPEVIPINVASKIIVLNTYLTFVKDIYELWTLFDTFKEKQAIGLVENQNNEYLERINSETAIIGRGFNTDVILFNLKVLQTSGWEEVLLRAVNDIIPLFNDTQLTDQNIINAVVSGNFELLHIISCDGNTQIFTESYNCLNKSQIKIVNWNTPKKFLSTVNNGDYFESLQSKFHEYSGTCSRTQLQECADLKDNIQKPAVTSASNNTCEDFHEAYLYKWRILPFFRKFGHNSSQDDVTLVSHFSYDRLPAVEKLSERWEGPMSLVLFGSDSELYKFMNFVEQSKLLQKRFNIAYHAIFKERYHHPINLCRNVALRNVVTPYVFLNDIDFIPMPGMYGSLKKYVSTIKGMEKKVLVVPAFDTNRKLKEKLPTTKEEVVKGMNRNYLGQFHKSFSGGHAPTNYAKWKTAEKPYKIEWKFHYEPYVVVQSNVTGYDDRFVGFGLDKISYFVKLKAQGYEFIVLPKAFVVHKRHKDAPEKHLLKESKRYRKCLDDLMMAVVKELSKQYGIEILTK